MYNSIHITTSTCANLVSSDLFLTFNLNNSEFSTSVHCSPSLYNYFENMNNTEHTFFLKVIKYMHC